MSETPNEGAGGVSVEGQDERPTVEWVATNLEATASKLSLPHGPEFLERAVDDLLARAVDVRALGAALVGSEARERELVEIAAKERGHAARHLDRALKAEARERVEVAHAHERGYRRGRVEAEAREAVLVEALKEIAEAKEGQRGSEVGLDFRAKLQAIARSALAGVVEAEPASLCFCGHPEREGYGHRSHECCRIGRAEPDGSERA